MGYTQQHSRKIKLIKGLKRSHFFSLFVSRFFRKSFFAKARKYRILVLAAAPHGGEQQSLNDAFSLNGASRVAVDFFQKGFATKQFAKSVAVLAAAASLVSRTSIRVPSTLDMLQATRMKARALCSSFCTRIIFSLHDVLRAWYPSTASDDFTQLVREQKRRRNGNV